jgi:hypothetical protein
MTVEYHFHIPHAVSETLTLNLINALIIQELERKQWQHRYSNVLLVFKRNYNLSILSLSMHLTYSHTQMIISSYFNKKSPYYSSDVFLLVKVIPLERFHHQEDIKVKMANV